MNPLPMQEIVDFFGQMCLILLRLHANGCFHGDLKPKNIMVDT